MTADRRRRRRRQGRGQPPGSSPRAAGPARRPDNDLLPWYDRCDWQSDPALAYLRGLQDGVELGRMEAERRLVAALTEAFGGPGCTDMRRAIRRHLRAVDARRARAEADGAGPRPAAA